MFRVGSRFTGLSFVSIVATASLGSVAMMPAFAQENKLSKAEQVLLKHAIASCKSEAKTKKVKFAVATAIRNRLRQALKDRPQVNVQEVLKNHPDLKNLPCRPRPDLTVGSAC